MLQSLFVSRWWNCHTSKFYSCCAYRSGEIHVLQISRCSICFPWATDTVCALIVIPYTILEISKFSGQLLVDNDNDDKKSQLNPSIALLCSEK